MSEKAREAIQDQEIQELNSLIYQTVVGTTPNKVTTVFTQAGGDAIVIATKVE